MTEYSADADLTWILCKNGFIETTSLRDVAKGKHEFRTTKTSRRYIYFDYINIRVFDGKYQDEKITLSSDDVKALIFYFICNRQDYKAIRPDGDFKFSKMLTEIAACRKELKVKVDFPQMRIPEKRMKRALAVFDNISIES